MTDVFIAHQDIKKGELDTNEELLPIPKTKHRPHALSSFCINPTGVHFESQQENEKILLFLRSHFITNISWIFIAIVLVLAPAIIPFVFPLLNLNLSFIPPGLLTISILFYYLIIFSYALSSFMTWFYNIFIVTEQRIVDIDYSHTVIHNVAETKLTHIQDVNHTQVGFIGSLLNFGNISVQTSGNEVNFEALSIPQPRKVGEIIASLIGGKV